MQTGIEHWTNKVTIVYRLLDESIQVSFSYYKRLLEFHHDETGLIKGIRTIS